MPMSSISPARRRQSHQIMRKVNENIYQIPMPYGIRIRVRPALDKFIIRIPSRHVMANQNPRPLRQFRVTVSGGRQLHRRLIKRVMERLEVGPGLQFLERLERVRDRNCGHCGIERGRWVGGRWRPFLGVAGGGVFHNFVEEWAEALQGGEGFGVVGFYISKEGHRSCGGEETPLELTQILQPSGVYEDVVFTVILLYSIVIDGRIKRFCRFYSYIFQLNYVNCFLGKSD